MRKKIYFSPEFIAQSNNPENREVFQRVCAVCRYIKHGCRKVILSRNIKKG